MSAAPAVLNLNGDGYAAPIRRGDTYSHPFTFVTSAGAAIDKSACTFRAQIRDLPGDAAAATASFTVALSGAGSNVVTISMTATQTAQLAPGTYAWDLEETTGSTVVTRVAGEAVISQDVSRP